MFSLKRTKEHGLVFPGKFMALTKSMVEMRQKLKE